MKATFILPSVVESTLEGCRAAARIAYSTYFFAAVHVIIELCSAASQKENVAGASWWSLCARSRRRWHWCTKGGAMMCIKKVLVGARTYVVVFPLVDRAEINLRVSSKQAWWVHIEWNSNRCRCCCWVEDQQQPKDLQQSKWNCCHIANTSCWAA